MFYLIHQVNKWSIEDVELSLCLSDDDKSSGSIWLQGFKVEGLIAEGIHVKDDKFELSDDLHQSLSVCLLSWTLVNTNKNKDMTVSFPLYLTKQRLVLVSEILVPISTTTITATSDNTIIVNKWIQRGVAIIIQSN